MTDEQAIKITFVEHDGTRHDVPAEVGSTVMRTATANLVRGVIGECGGEMSCATCHVFVDEQWYPRLAPKTADEDDMLDVTAEDSTQYSRLSCQIHLDASHDGLVVHIPKTQL
ncbi:2Fe-2S iron-sulfur cluster-binding protein [Mycolicibacterium sp.]|uniref:2Fe-2S iron-sulfur cluster-binding protein n=1 Tax=Mycolicibacterium sp. TaxID=2320850 RepID=UPI003D0A1D2F